MNFNIVNRGVSSFGGNASEAKNAACGSGDFDVDGQHSFEIQLTRIIDEKLKTVTGQVLSQKPDKEIFNKESGTVANLIHGNRHGL